MTTVYHAMAAIFVLHGQFHNCCITNFGHLQRNINGMPTKRININQKAPITIAADASLEYFFILFHRK